LLELPRELPGELNGRRLWHTPRAYIYAADKAVAGETDRWIADLAGHLRRTYQSDLGKGLVIVVDKDEPAVVPSFDELVRLQRLAAEQSGESRDALPTVEKQRAKLAESGMSEELARRVNPVPLDDAALASAGLTGPLPVDTSWRMCCASSRLAESATWEFAPAALERKKGKAFVVMTAWALPLAVPEAAKVFQLARDTLAFQMWATRRSDWTLERRQAEIDRYMRERALVLSPTLALALAIAKGQQ